MRKEDKTTESEKHDAYTEKKSDLSEKFIVATVCPRCGKYCNSFHGVLTRFGEYLDGNGKQGYD